MKLSHYYTRKKYSQEPIDRLLHIASYLSVKLSLWYFIASISVVIEMNIIEWIKKNCDGCPHCNDNGFCLADGEKRHNITAMARKYKENMCDQKHKPVIKTLLTVKKSKALCHGCYNNWYNYNKGGCWSYENAKVVTKKLAPTLNTLPKDFVCVICLDCYRRDYNQSIPYENISKKKVKI